MAKIHPFKHFRTITKHRHQVIKNCRKSGILWQGLRHDLSKYAPTEFWAGAKYYAGNHSPNENERRDKGYSAAWMHHKGRNRHHFEYWSDVNPISRMVEPVEMPVNYAAEMFCDRVAASKIYKGKSYTDKSALEYYLSGIKSNRAIHKNTALLLESWLYLLAEKGEEEAFKAVKKAVKDIRKNKTRRFI